MNQYVSQGVFDRRVKLIEEKLKHISDTNLLNRLQAEQEDFIKRLEEIELDGSIPDYFIADYNAFKANTLRIDDVYDANGQFDGSKIKPLSISTAALTVGQRSQQLSLTGVEFSVTPYSHSGGYYGTLEWSDGSMFHYGFINENSEPKVYTITSGSFALGNSAYYIYAYIANLESTTTTAEIKVSTNQIKVDGEGKPSDFPNGYYVQLGYVSVELDSGSSESSNRYYRKVDTTYGQTTINGRLITTGRIEGSSGANYVYFDLDKGEIGGTIKFKDNGTEYDYATYINNKIGDYDLNTNQSFVNAIEDLQDQLDGVVDSYFMDGIPTMIATREPIVSWDNSFADHKGDTYTDTLPENVNLSELKNNNPRWIEQGFLDASSINKTYESQLTDSSYYCRTRGLFAVDSGITLKAKSGISMYVVYYDSNKEYISNSGWQTTDISFSSINSNYIYFAVIYANTTNLGTSSITPSDLIGLQTIGNIVYPYSAHSWKFVEDGSNFAWLEISDSDVVRALAMAAAAQDTADGKRRVFVSTPYTPYDEGDLWANAKYPTDTGATFNNVLLKCKQTKTNLQSFDINDWEASDRGVATADEAKAKAFAVEAAANAELFAIKDGTTTIAGGMVKSNLIELNKFKYTEVESGSSFNPNTNYYIKQGNTYLYQRGLTSFQPGVTYYTASSSGVNSGVSGIDDFPAFWAGGSEIKSADVRLFRNAYDNNNLPQSSPYYQYIYKNGVKQAEYLAIKDYAESNSNSPLPNVFIDFDGISRFGDLYLIEGAVKWTPSTDRIKLYDPNDNTDYVTLKFNNGALQVVRKDGGQNDGIAGVYSDWISALGANSSGGGGSGGGINWADFWNELNLSDTHSYSGTKIIDRSYLPINGISSSNGTFYAPTSAGTSGYILKSNGSGAPSWTAQSNLSVGSASTANKLGTSNVGNAITPFYLSGGVATICNIYRYHYDATSDYASYAWHKVAYAVASATTDRVITLLVTKGNSVTTNGILKCRVRWDANSAFNSDNTKLNWVVNNGIDVNNFVFVWKSPNIELWCKITEQWGGYQFTVLDSGSRAGNGGLTWTMCDSVSGHGSASYTSGGTVITSTNATLNNNISGTINGYSIASTINSGTANRLAYYTSSGIDDASTTYVSNTKLAINSTSEPSYNFYVNGTSYLNGETKTQHILPITNTTYNIGSSSNFYAGVYSNRFVVNTGSANSGLYKNSDITSTGASTTLWLYNSNLLKLYGSAINLNANVGIGTDSPAYKLDVNGSTGHAGGHIYLTGSHASSSVSNTTQLVFGTSSTNHVVLSANTKKLIINPSTSSTTGQIILGVNGENTIFTSSGNFGIGTTSPPAKLSVAGDIYASGGVTALQAVSSDKMLKKNIKKFNAKDIIDKLNPVSFEWNSRAKKLSDFKDGTNYGLIAQDSDGIIDNLVFDLPDGNGYKGVRYEKLIPILLQAVKEQQKEIDELKSIVKQLKNK